MLSRVSLRWILITVAVLVGGLSPLLLWYRSSREIRELFVDENLGKYRALARAAAAEYAKYLSLHLAAVKTLADEASVGGRLRPDTLGSLLAHTRRNYREFVGTAVVDPAGAIVVREPAPDANSLAATNVADREWFQTVRRTRRPLIDSHITISRFSGLPVVVLAAPITAPGGGLRGIVSAGLDVQAIRELAETVRLGRTGHLVVVTATGAPVALPASEDVRGRHDFSRLPIWTTIGGSESGLVRSYRDALGEERLAGFATVSEVEWKVWVSQTVAELQDKIAAAYWRVSGELALFVALVVAGAGVLAIVVVRPIHALHVAAAALALGQLERRAPERGPREVVLLARTFNEMASSLQRTLLAERDSKARLEAAVEEYATLAAKVTAGDLSARAPAGGHDALSRLARSLNGTIESITRLVARLRETNDTLQALIDGAPVAILSLAGDGRVTVWNPAAARLFGWRADEVCGGPLPRGFAPADDEPALRALTARALGGEPLDVEIRCGTRSGGAIDVHLATAALRDQDGRVRGALAVLVDVTERTRAEEGLRLAEEQARHAQKMEAVGRLAGGVAHDFNNLLTVIQGRSEFALRRLPPEAPVRRDIELIRRSAERAASVTRQLLAFSRKQVLQPVVLDLAAAVEETAELVRRLVGEDVEVNVLLPGAPAWVRADRSQLDQVIMNLVVNARDAMPAGGRLRLEVSVDDSAPGAFGPSPPPAGGWARLRVADSGVGMDRETRERLFEPFFTTKGPGRGTGLGLATVYGIVKQHGGEITVQSKLGEGAAFDIHLPLVDPPGIEAAAAALPLRGGSETLLLVEDEPDVRALARELLDSLGYRVLEAGGADEALRIAERHFAPIHLLVTDVIMPGMNGRELAGLLLQTRPELAVLYVSGYTDDVIAEHGVLGDGVSLLHKPFTGEDLAHCVRDALDRPPR